MSWAFLVYAIDILSTNGRYVGWACLLFLCMVAYTVLWFSRLCESGEAYKPTFNFYEGKVMTAVNDYSTLKTGDKVVIEAMSSSGFNSGKMTLRYPNGEISPWLCPSVIRYIVAPDEPTGEFKDLLKPLRRLVVTTAVFCVLGIGYANFMPSKETAYKMLAAYVGQTMVETPEVRETAGNAIDFLNKAIKKYSVELEKDEEAADLSAKTETKKEE